MRAELVQHDVILEAVAGHVYPAHDGWKRKVDPQIIPAVSTSTDRCHITGGFR